MISAKALATERSKTAVISAKALATERSKTAVISAKALATERSGSAEKDEINVSMTLSVFRDGDRSPRMGPI